MRLPFEFLSRSLCSTYKHLDCFDASHFTVPSVALFCVCINQSSWCKVCRKKWLLKQKQKKRQRDFQTADSVHYLNHELKVVACCHTKRCDKMNYKMKNPIFAKFVVFFRASRHSCSRDTFVARRMHTCVSIRLFSIRHYVCIAMSKYTNFQK